MYLTYKEYAAYGGDLSESAYAVEEFKARKVIDYLTAGRVSAMQEVPQEVKFCMVEIIRYNQRFSASALVGAPLLASFNTDGYSESYGSADAQTAAARRELYLSLQQMLSGVEDDEGTPLLYRGLC